MQILIEISEESYKKLTQKSMLMSASAIDEAVDAVKKGKILPKVHGRLGDLDELETYFKNVRRKLKPEDYKYAVEYFTRDNMLLNAEQFIHLMDALIPADKGVES